jgi:hypothetical protein
MGDGENNAENERSGGDHERSDVRNACWGRGESEKQCGMANIYVAEKCDGSGACGADSENVARTDESSNSHTANARNNEENPSKCVAEQRSNNAPHAKEK